MRHARLCERVRISLDHEQLAKLSDKTCLGIRFLVLVDHLFLLHKIRTL
jgi:hypothetical protein